MALMTGSVDDLNLDEPRRMVELAGDVWFMIMSLLSPSDVVSLGRTCKTLFEYSQYRHVWRSALINHRFLAKSYPHLCQAETSAIRRQLITTARIDAAFSRDALKPVRSHSFPLDFPGVFQGIKFVPGTDWLVLLFHSRTLNPSRHSNICLFKPPTTDSSSEDKAPTSVTLQSERCWLHIRPRDGPYKSSRGDDLLLLRTFVKADRTFAICHLNTNNPSVKITFMVHTAIQTRNHIVAGDYLVYGWISEDRKHMVRIMKLNEDYTGLVKDVIAEIDCPPGHDGRLMVRYDLRLSGKQPRLLLITTRLMAAYDISDDALISGRSSSPLKLQTVWKHVPENVSFGRILRVCHEGAIVTMYEGNVKFIYPKIDDPRPDAKMIANYDFLSAAPLSTRFPAVFTPQRIFWPLCFPNPGPASMGMQHLVEAAMLPIPENEDRKIGRILVEHNELAPETGALTCDAQDWDELSGKLCVRCVRSRFPNDRSWRKTSWRFAILEMV